MSETDPGSDEPAASIESKPSESPDFLTRSAKGLLGVVTLCVAAPFGTGSLLVAILTLATLLALAGGLVWSLAVTAVTALLAQLLLAVGFVAALLATIVVGFVVAFVLFYVWLVVMAVSNRTSPTEHLAKLVKEIKS